jgi:hypothetical protein
MADQHPPQTSKKFFNRLKKFKQSTPLSRSQRLLRRLPLLLRLQKI